MSDTDRAYEFVLTDGKHVTVMGWSSRVDPHGVTVMTVDGDTAVFVPMNTLKMFWRPKITQWMHEETVPAPLIVGPIVKEVTDVLDEVMGAYAEAVEHCKQNTRTEA